MPKMTFYRQKRVDGGIRTGLEWNESRAFETFEEGLPEEVDNPLGAGLRWYVDLRCEGDGLPEAPEKGRQWLIEHQGPIANGLSRLGDTLRAGWDWDVYPIRWSDFEDVPPGVLLTLVASSMRRVDALELAEVLRDLGANWTTYLEQLEPFVGAYR